MSQTAAADQQLATLVEEMVAVVDRDNAEDCKRAMRGKIPFTPRGSSFILGGKRIKEIFEIEAALKQYGCVVRKRWLDALLCVDVYRINSSSKESSSGDVNIKSSSLFLA